MDGKRPHKKHFHEEYHERHHEKHSEENNDNDKNKEELVYNLEKCVFCGICGEICKKGAIVVDQINRTWDLTKSLCVKCGHCIRKCKVGALEFT
ncbi:MAG: 4Fe-4S binding protein [Treponema sp.]|jgi:formate hydrogenlyase subunit 6/NADH:ubiquinone oxidoreductase subunit I|nr:4Fe-4S binding protein [Treponema sp.]